MMVAISNAFNDISNLGTARPQIRELVTMERERHSLRSGGPR